MRRELLMPKLGLTMTEGALLEWLVKPGERFRAEQSVFVVESEKAAVEVPAEADGVLLEISIQPGTTVPVGTAVGVWDELGCAGASTSTVDRSARVEAPEPSSAAASSVPVNCNAALDSAEQPRCPPDRRLVATPLARRLARERGVDLTTVQGSGPRGRIRAKDLPETTSASPRETISGAASIPGERLTPPSATQQAIARRLVAAKQEIPHFYLAVEAEVSALQKLRSELNAAQADVRFTLNHFVLAAVGRTLTQMPEVNRVWTAEGILSLPGSDVGMAVHTERGVIVPVMRDIGSKPLAELARRATDASVRAQGGRLGPQEMTGGAVTVSNAGMHDVTYMTSIINPGQAMILGVGTVRGVFRPGDTDQPVLRREMGLVLSADHRVLDGVTALRFLKRIVANLGNPLALLVA